MDIWKVNRKIKTLEFGFRSLSGGVDIKFPIDKRASNYYNTFNN